MCEQVMQALSSHKVEFRRGTAGGGNHLRQPYLKDIAARENLENYPEVDHIHFYCFYLGNYPGLEQSNILKLCLTLNQLCG